MTSVGNNCNDFSETTSTGHRIMKNDRLIHMGKISGVSDLPESLHVKSCSVRNVLKFILSTAVSTVTM